MNPGTRSVGSRQLRVTDPTLLRGGGRYLDDIDLPGMLHAAIVRSPVAHGRLHGLDRSGLTTPPALVLGPAEIRGRLVGGLPVVWHLPGQFQFHKAVLDDKVRYVGEPIGVVVASSRHEAEDSVDELVADIDPLPVVVAVDDALAADAPQLYDEGNVMCAWEAGNTEAHTRSVLDAAERTLTTRLTIGRLAGMPMEGRGVVAMVEPSGKLVVWISTQAPHVVRDAIVDATGLPQHRIRVIAPDVGGGFGVKDHLYEDELFVILAALELGVPVKWVEDRAEMLVGSHHARDERYEIEVGYDDDGRLRGLRVEAVRNGGASLGVFGGGPLFAMTGMLPGPYTWDAVRTEARVVATNTTPLGSYRGFGQTQAAFVRERAVDLVASALGMDPAEVRARNLITDDEQPYPLRTAPITLDNGDYPAALALAREAVAAWPDPPPDGRSRGTGYGMYVQMAGIGPSIGNMATGLVVGGWEQTVVRMERDGTVRLTVGVTPHGQGHETTFAQLVSDRLGVPVSHVELLHSDTDFTPYSAYGTAASRSIAVGGAAAVQASERLAEKLRTLAAMLLEAEPFEIELRDEQALVADDPERSISLADLAVRAWQGWDLPKGMDAGLMEMATYDPAQFTFSYAVHACRAAVDRATGAVDIERYVVVNDCGTIVNPTVVEGQLHGGIAQGLSAALLEEVLHDADGTPRTTTLSDYLLPVQATIPDIEVIHVETPSPSTPGGMKGMGEGGTNGAFPCVVNAVAAALPDIGSDIVQTPLTPSRLWTLLRASGVTGA